MQGRPFKRAPNRVPGPQPTLMLMKERKCRLSESLLFPGMIRTCSRRMRLYPQHLQQCVARGGHSINDRVSEGWNFLELNHTFTQWTVYLWGTLGLTTFLWRSGSPWAGPRISSVDRAHGCLAGLALPTQPTLSVVSSCLLSTRSTAASGGFPSASCSGLLQVLFPCMERPHLYPTVPHRWASWTPTYLSGLSSDVAASREFLCLLCPRRPPQFSPSCTLVYGFSLW